MRDRFASEQMIGLTSECVIDMPRNIQVDDIWPASIKNIPANVKFPFEWLDNVEGFHKFDVSVIEVKNWR
jgi:hypothetical protein